MIDKFQLLTAGLAALSLGTMVSLPAFAAEATSAVPLGAGYPLAPYMEPRLAPHRPGMQVADNMQSTGSSSSASASSSASSSVSIKAGQKTGKCTAEASAHAKANGVEDSDHDMKVIEGDGCSAKAESSATVKSQPPKSE